jgi:outer membrane receptor protein involved in Fe transport
VLVTYANTARVHLQGVDRQLDWALPIGPGTLNANVLVNYLISFESSPLSSLPMLDYAGTFGTTENGLNQGAYEYRVLATLGYGVGGTRLALQWQHLPSVEDSAEPVTPNATTGAPAYNIFNLNGSAEVGEIMTVRFGVDNLFNKAPPRVGIDLNADPAVGQLGGGSFNRPSTTPMAVGSTWARISGFRTHMHRNQKLAAPALQGAASGLQR